MRRGRAAITALLIVSALAATTGVLMALVVESQASFGYYAYQPLADAVFTPGLGLWPATVWWLLVAGVGLLGVGFSTGWLIAVRRRGA
ncbi:hypothetical protein G5T42_01860 [Microbacterium sp. 4R-513]|uniref:hypothetical protein n=1 Tax=Microbacterium sp. 4R-513 TaxID=2567934 RepID=UPI0013E1A170|nr:hypothetical protein [Microbacterium sp. 4R-513]QIG38060.1 hypothetical protein G5T42_01860 [Microbacterium sp. 4R-513]